MLIASNPVRTARRLALGLSVAALAAALSGCYVVPMQPTPGAPVQSPAQAAASVGAAPAALGCVAGGELGSSGVLLLAVNHQLLGNGADDEHGGPDHQGVLHGW